MPSSSRTECPYCYSYRIEALTEVIKVSVSRSDYFRCKDCRRMWSVPSGQDGPPEPRAETTQD